MGVQRPKARAGRFTGTIPDHSPSSDCKAAPAIVGMKTVCRCVYCGHLSTGRVPRNGREVGDGTCRYPRRHKLMDDFCPGVFREADLIDVPRTQVVAGDPYPTKRNALHARR